MDILGWGAALLAGWLGLAPAVGVSSGTPDLVAAARPAEARIVPWAEPTKVVHVPSSIDPTGTRNVHDELQAFIDRVPDRRVIAFPAGAVYQLGDRALLIQSRRDLVLEGNGTTLQASGCRTKHSVILVTGTPRSERITIRGFILEGSNPEPATPRSYRAGCEWQMGVAIFGASRVEVEHLVVRLVAGDCFYVGSAGHPPRWSEQVHIHDTTCTDNGRNGTAIVAARHVIVERNTYDRIAIHVFDIEPHEPQGGANDIWFRDNTVHAFGFSDLYTGYFFAQGGNRSAFVTDVHVIRNLLTNRPMRTRVTAEGQTQRTRIGFTFADNVSAVAADGPLVRFFSIDRIRVSGNVQPQDKGEPFLEITDCRNVVYNGERIA